jgi:hypothetical protein
MGVASMYIASTAQIASGILTGGTTIMPIKPDAVNTGTWTLNQSTSTVFACYSQGSNADGNNCTYKVPMAAGTYTIQVIYGQGTNFAKFDIQIDGAVVVSGIDGYAGGDAWNTISETTGVTITSGGIKNLKVIHNGKNGLSSGYFSRIEGIIIRQTA